MFLLHFFGKAWECNIIKYGTTTSNILTQLGLSSVETSFNTVSFHSDGMVTAKGKKLIIGALKSIEITLLIIVY